jgi:glutamate synthase (NADPH) large chain
MRFAKNLSPRCARPWAPNRISSSKARHCRQLALDQPILTNEDLARIKAFDAPGFKTVTLPDALRSREGRRGLKRALDELNDAASQAVREGATILVLSDRGIGPDRAAIPALLACAGVHHRLIRDGLRTSCGLIVESGEAREVQHFALLIGYGACGINPYLAFDVIADRFRHGAFPEDGTLKDYHKAYIKAVNAGVLKVMSKMGISTLASYRGAQIYEAVGLNRSVIDEYFTWTPSRIQGIGLDAIAEETSGATARASRRSGSRRAGARERRRLPMAPRRRIPCE